jgi:hypothetical protein
VVVPALGCAEARQGREFGADAAWLPDAGGGAPDAKPGKPKPDAGGGASALVINEFVVSHTGTDENEYVELKGSPDTTYDDHSILVIEGEGTAIGTIDRVFPVGTTDADGRFATPYTTNQLENDSLTILLVRDLTVGVGLDLDGDDDGELEDRPWTEIMDAVAVQVAEGAVTYAGEAVLTPDHDAIGLPVGGASRMPDGADGGGPSDWVRNDFDGAGLPCCSGEPAAGTAFNTPGTPNEIRQ